MMKKLLLPVILLVLSLGFWVSPDFQEIAAGVAIFLFGMLMLEDGFKLFSGGFLERALEKATGSVARSIGFGIVTTTIMQSSSLVSVITISFLSAGLISLLAGVGIIFGANIGTTTGAWLVAGFGLKVNISAYALPMLAISIILVFQKSKYLRGGGFVLAGVGEWPVWGNCLSDFARAAKVDSPRDLVSRRQKSNGRCGLEAVVRCRAAPVDRLNDRSADKAAISALRKFARARRPAGLDPWLQGVDSTTNFPEIPGSNR